MNHRLPRAKTLALLVLLAGSATPALACYTVFDQSNRVLYQAQVPPVNMSMQIHDTLPQVYPGSYMVFDNKNDCPIVNTTQNRQALNNAIDTKKVADRSIGRPSATAPAAGITPAR